MVEAFFNSEQELMEESMTPFFRDHLGKRDLRFHQYLTRKRVKRRGENKIIRRVKEWTDDKEGEEAIELLDGKKMNKKMPKKKTSNGQRGNQLST